MSIKLKVPEPCHEDWNKMMPGEQGRFCNACARNVVDFSMMSDKEVLEYFSTAGANVCGRFNNDQLNKKLEEKRPRRFSWVYMWNMLVAATLLSVDAKAQTKKPVHKKSVAPVKKTTAVSIVMGAPVIRIPDEKSEPEKPAVLSARILDKETNQPVGFATITAKSIAYGFAADSNGHFTMKVQPGADTLEISAIGYRTAIHHIDATDPEPVIYLEAAQKELDPVVIKSGYRYITALAGGVTMVRSVSFKEKVGRLAESLLPKKDVVVYPNPVLPGNTLQVRLALKEAGEHRLELFAVNGQLMHAEQVQMNTKEQTLSLLINPNWSRGIYWLRVSNRTSKSVYQSKVLVQ
ncbi:MAG: carboxypeptidase-like regulatory domain-containing protein [Chitinophagaceae bacterium]